MQRIPSSKSLRGVYPHLTTKTAQLCRDVMRAQVNPLDHPVWFPRTTEVAQTTFVDTPPRLIRILALADLLKAPQRRDGTILESYGVSAAGSTRGGTARLYWLWSPVGPTALTLCSIAPLDPPTRREQQRDPWLYRDQQTTETYRLAVPAQLLKQRNRSR